MFEVAGAQVRRRALREDRTRVLDKVQIMDSSVY